MLYGLGGCDKGCIKYVFVGYFARNVVAPLDRRHAVRKLVPIGLRCVSKPYLSLLSVALSIIFGSAFTI
jgi:hypothetical protein